jgi:NAD(P)-dependent dehydrogenase (short-subunit alcohol dehydrogenase family)
MTMKDLKGRTAVITGGGSGLGRGTALELANHGVNLVLADINLESAEESARMAAEAGVQAVGVACDVAQPDAFHKLKAEVEARFGFPDVVMNNVGVLTGGRPEDIPPTEWERILNTNLMSVVRSNEAFLPGFLARGSGHIVNVASTAGLYSYAFDRAPYAASKAAVISLTEGLALYLKPKGIGVSVMCPGPMPTNVGKSRVTFGAPLGVRGPGADFVPMPPQEAGALIVDAILNDRFFVTTHPAQVMQRLRRRLEDWDGFVAASAKEIDEALSYGTALSS